MNSTATTTYNPLAECKAAREFALTIRNLVNAGRLDAAANINGAIMHLDRAIAMLTRGPLAAAPQPPATGGRDLYGRWHDDPWPATDAPPSGDASDPGDADAGDAD